MAIGYAAPITSMVPILRLPAQTIGQKLGRFPYDFLNENPRHKPALRGSGAPKPALLTRGPPRTPIGAVTLSLLGHKHQ